MLPKNCGANVILPRFKNKQGREEHIGTVGGEERIPILQLPALVIVSLGGY